MSNPPIAYTKRPGTTPETELGALANVYKFVLASHARKEAVTSPVCRPDDAKEIKNDSRHHHRNT